MIANCDLDILWIQSDSCVSSWLCCGQDCGDHDCLYLGTEHLPMPVLMVRMVQSILKRQNLG